MRPCLINVSLCCIFLISTLTRSTLGEIIVWDEEDDERLTLKIESTFLEFRKNQIFNDDVYLFVGDASITGCEKLPRPPNIISLSDQRPSWVLLMDNNHDCEAHEKIINVQSAGYEGLIVVVGSTNADEEILDINPQFKSKFKINVSLIRHIDGINLKQFAVKTRHSKRYTLTVRGKVKKETTTTTPRPPPKIEEPMHDSPPPPPKKQEPEPEKPLSPPVKTLQNPQFLSNANTNLLYIALIFLLPPGLYFLSKCKIQDVMILFGMIGVILLAIALSKSLG